MSNGNTDMAYAYTTLLGPPGTTLIEPLAISANGSVAGVLNNFYGFTFSNGTYAEVTGPAGNLGVELYGINNTEAVGYYFTGLVDVPFVFHDGKMTVLTGSPAADDSFLPVAINDSGTIAGVYNFPAGDSAGGLSSYTYGLIDDAGVYTTLYGPEGSVFVEPKSINNLGQVVGFYRTPADPFGNFNVYGFLYDKGVYTTLFGPPGSTGANAVGADNAGEVVGNCEINGQYHAFIYKGGNYTLLSGPAVGDSTRASGVNDKGDIIGVFSSDNFANSQAAFVDVGGTYSVLSGPSDVGTTGLIPLAINDSDQITGYYQDPQKNNEYVGFIAEPVCYLRGTRLLSPTGPVAVEDLKIGDLLVTRLHGTRPIKWIGRQSFQARSAPHSRDTIPVCIEPGALGDHQPARRLFVSPGHSMLLDGTLVLAKSLVNGITITQDHAPEEIHYHQIEFETHDCILAEGTWSESYADCAGMRSKFDNAAEFFELYSSSEAPMEPLLCAPRPLSGPGLDAALRPVIGRATAGLLPGAMEGYVESLSPACITGWAMDSTRPDLPLLLSFHANGRPLGTALACMHRADLLDAGKGNGNHGFDFIPPAPLRAILSDVVVTCTADGTALPRHPACVLLAA